ncbi:MAG: lamin tail domain-containing protein [Crocinitomicaceae bacterium]|nr:lamin tail domain-containing protein [Crocinitomicaceae bacterium]
MKKLLLALICLSSISFAQNIVITEIMYNPAESGTDSTEFIEFYNNTSNSIDLTGYTTIGVTYTFPSVSLAPGAYYVISVNPSAHFNTYGVNADGQFAGALANGGEPVALYDNLGTLVDSVNYDDIAPWPVGFSAGEPDGGGASLVICNYTLDNNDGANWSASTTSTGLIVNGLEVLASPGAANDCCSIAYGTDVQTACGSYQWIDGNTYTANNNTATHTINNGSVSGCDSIVTLDLTINPVASGTDVQTACLSYTWIDGNTYTASNNTATHTIVNGAANGCDSIVTLDLTINTVDVTVSTSSPTITANASGATYQWLDCGSMTQINGETNQSYTATAGGSYAVIVNDGTCQDTSDCQVITFVGIEDLNAQLIVVSPNPSNGIFQLKGTGKYAYSVADISGKTILTGNMVENTLIDLSAFESGIYLLTLQQESRIETIKLIRE